MTNWETCVQFHGHACGGLTIGYKAACYAAELLELSFSGDEQVVCIAENDACGVDAIQALLGCSIGKGNRCFTCAASRHFPSITAPRASPCAWCSGRGRRG